MKPREPRRNVMIAARLRHGDRWSDASILNISSRGLLLHADRPPLRGTYVEVRRGEHVIIARAIWTKTNRFGVCTQERLAIDLLVASASPDGQRAKDSDGAPLERRVRPRPGRLEWRHSQSRDKGRALQFAFTIGFGFLLAACAYDAVTKTLSRPLSEISSRLGGAS